MKLYLIFSLVALAQNEIYVIAGKQQTGTKLAEFCAHAMLTLEVLIHPKTYPLVDYVRPNNNTYEEAKVSFRDEYFSRNNPFGLPEAKPPVRDEITDYLINDDDDLGVLWTESTKDTNKSSEMVTPLPSSTDIQESSEIVPEIATYTDVEMRTVNNDTVFKSDHPGESITQYQEPVACTTSNPVVIDTHGDAATDIESERIVSDDTIPHNEANHVESDQGSLGDKGFELASLSKSSVQTSDSNMVPEFAFKINYGKLLDDVDDPFPDIVDGDPDSDSGSE